MIRVVQKCVWKKSQKINTKMERISHPVFIVFFGKNIDEPWWWQSINNHFWIQGCIFRLTCSHWELTKDHVLTSAYVKFFTTVTRNAVNKSVWRKKRLFLTSLKQTCNEYLYLNVNNIQEPEHGSLRIRAHLKVGEQENISMFSTCSHPGW